MLNGLTYWHSAVWNIIEHRRRTIYIDNLLYPCNVLNFFFSSTAGRIFKKIDLNESIRYATGDPIESWLNGLLCLDVANYIPNITRLKTCQMSI